MMNDKFEIIKERYSKTESKLSFADEEPNGTQIVDDKESKIEFAEKIKEKTEKKFFLFHNSKIQTHGNAHEYNIVHYLIFYLILFVFIGISTIIIMEAT